MLRLHECQTRYGRIIIVSLECSTLVVWGENPVTVGTLRLLYIDLIRVIATVMESANTGGILFSPVFTVNINCWEVVFTAAFTVFNNSLPVTVLFSNSGDFANCDLGNGSFKSFLNLREGLQQEGEDIKIKIQSRKTVTVKVTIDDRCFDSG